MAILIDNDTKLVVQGLTGREGQFIQAVRPARFAPSRHALSARIASSTCARE